MKLNHLTEADHIELARLLREAQELLKRSAAIVNRAPWSNRVLRVEKAVQERLIDPLREAHDDMRYRKKEPEDRSGMYPSIHYAVR